MMLINPYVSFGSGGGGPTDPYFSSVSSLLHCDGADASTTFTDQKGKTWTASGNAQIDTAQSKFGGASGLFDGNGDYISTPSHADFSFGSGEFTVEAWVRFNSLAASGNQGLIVRDEIGGTRGWLMFTQDASGSVNDGLAFAAWVGTTSYVVADTIAMTSGGSFKHIAAVRDQSGGGDVLRLYKDGVMVGTSTSITGSVGAPSRACVVGALWGLGTPIAASYFNGWIDDVRITKGVCRYPSGTTFTPPTAAFPDS